jgi:hypothetical protein
VQGTRGVFSCVASVRLLGVITILRGFIPRKIFNPF